MTRWFILSAIGQDRPGLVADLSQLIYDCDANLEDSRMTILGTDFAVILLASSNSDGCGDALAHGAKRLERDHGLTILLRALDGGPRAALPAEHVLLRVRAAGEDKAGIVASLSRVLAEHGINILELSTRSQPGPGGSPHYEMTVTAEAPKRTDLDALRAALDREANRLVIDVQLDRA